MNWKRLLTVDNLLLLASASCLAAAISTMSEPGATYRVVCTSVCFVYVLTLVSKTW